MVAGTSAGICVKCQRSNLMKETYKLAEPHQELVSQTFPQTATKNQSFLGVSDTYTGHEVFKDLICTYALKVWSGIISSTSYVLLRIEGNLTHILWLKYKNWTIGEKLTLRTVSTVETQTTRREHIDGPYRGWANITRTGLEFSYRSFSKELREILKVTFFT